MERLAQRDEVGNVARCSTWPPEHQLVKRRGWCGTATFGQAPEGVAAPVLYRPWVAAIVGRGDDDLRGGAPLDGFLEWVRASLRGVAGGNRTPRPLT